MMADFEISNLINELSGIHSPIFVDDAESIRDVNIKTNNLKLLVIYPKCKSYHVGIQQ